MKLKTLTLKLICKELRLKKDEVGAMYLRKRGTRKEHGLIIKSLARKSIKMC